MSEIKVLYEKSEEQKEEQNPEILIQEQLTQLNQKKLEEKRKILGRLDTRLRNNSIFKIVIILFVFFLYGCMSLYFNYQIYNFNEISTAFFYILTQRNIYGLILSITMRGVVIDKTKHKMYYSPNPEKELYFQDIVDKMYSIEARVVEYKQADDRTNFPKYFAQQDRLESQEMCDLIDSYSGAPSGNCAAKCKSPIEQGLSISMNYYIDYNVLYGNVIKATDFSNETAVTGLYEDPSLSYPGSKILLYIQSAIEMQLVTYRREATEFYELMSTIALLKGILFGIAYCKIKQNCGFNFNKSIGLNTEQDSSNIEFSINFPKFSVELLYSSYFLNDCY